MNIEQISRPTYALSEIGGNPAVEPMLEVRKSTIETFFEHVDRPELPEWHPDAGKIKYDLPILESFSRVSGDASSTLVLVRESTQVPPCLPSRYFVVTADLEKCTTWAISSVIPFQESSLAGNEQPGIELVLTAMDGARQQLHSAERQLLNADEFFNKMRALYEDRDAAAAARLAATTETRIILQQRCCWFVKPYGDYEMLEDLRTIYGKTPQSAQFIAPQPDSPVTIVAA